MHLFSQDGIFCRHLDYRPQRITKEEEHMISALEARELNKTSLLLKEFYDGAQLIQRVWAFDRLPNADLTTKTSRDSIKR
jgi:hypothetical protein